MDISDRTAIALDLENLVGLPPIDRPLADLKTALGDIARGRTAVSVVGYCARPLQRKLAFELARFGVRVFGHADRTPDAADRLLVEHVTSALPRSVGTVVIGSGDHIFAPVAASLRRRGLRVEVVARPGTLSSALYSACDRWYPVGTGVHDL